MVSINTNSAAIQAQTNIEIANNAASSSVARLSSGNRIVKASDDVAALATGTSLTTQVSALKTALTNASQGTSLLQVADGSLAQIGNILQQQKALALQAASGSLTNTDRGFLNQQFQALTSQINSLATGTTFNGVNLLDGSLSKAAQVTNTTTEASKGSASITFSNAISTGESVIINGITLIAGSSSSGTTFAVGGDTAGSVANLATRLNALAATSTYANSLGDVVFSANGSTLTATSRTGGALSNNFRISTAATASAVSGNFATTNGNASVTVTLASAAEAARFVEGQRVILNNGTDAAAEGIAATNLRGLVTAVSGSTVTFTAGSNADGTDAAVNAAAYLIADTADYNVEATFTAGSQDVSFDLFSVTTGLSAANQVVTSSDTSGTGQGAAVPFRAGEALQVTANGVTKTLYTYAASDTLEEIVNGINASTGTTGYTASLVYVSGGTYNIRLSTEGAPSTVLVQTGLNTNTGTLRITGENLDDTSGFIVGSAGTAGADRTRSIVSTGSLNLIGTTGALTITAADATAADVVGTVGSAASPFTAGDVITATINGETKILSSVLAASTTLNALVSDINSRTSTTGVYAALSGTDGGFNLRLFFASATPLADYINVDAGANVSTLASNTSTVLNTSTNTQAGLSINRVATLQSGDDDGLGIGSVVATGSVGNSILTTLTQSKAQVTVSLTLNAESGDYLEVGGKRFYYTSNTTRAANEILIGSTIAESIDNAIATINQYRINGDATGAEAYELNQVSLTRSGTSLIVSGKNLDDVTDLSGSTSTVATDITGFSITNSGNLDNASGPSTFGVDVTGVANSAFSGTISGFSATYDGTSGNATVSVQIGDFTYTADNATLVVGADSRIRFYSDTVEGKNGGYFDIQIASGSVTALTSQGQADTVADRLDEAFSTLTFIQNRVIASYQGAGNVVANGVSVGSLLGSKFTAQLSDFSNVKLSSVSVTAPSGSNTDAKITLTINGETYSTVNGIGSTLGANQTYRLLSSADPNQFIEFTTGDSTIVLDSAAKATALESTLETAFGISEDSAALQFQIGATSNDTLAVSIGSAKAEDLFGASDLNIATQTAAAVASEAITNAINSVTALRAGVGALQSQFSFASAALQTSVQNQDAARGLLLDTDIASESTSYATSQVKLQAGISVLAQANQQLQALLKLIG
ncbi:MAG: flagellin [Rickettsiales bacterium]|nr:flagellin [Rickettsiales bacterium]